MVERVERFRMELETEPLRKLEVLNQRDVCIGEVGPMEIIARAHLQPQRARECADRRGRIGKELQRTAGFVRMDVLLDGGGVAVENPGANRSKADGKGIGTGPEREASVPAFNPRYCPAADNLIQPTGSLPSKGFAAPEGQLVNANHADGVAEIKVGVAFAHTKIGDIANEIGEERIR